MTDVPVVALKGHVSRYEYTVSVLFFNDCRHTQVLLAISCHGSVFTLISTCMRLVKIHLRHHRPD